VNATAFKIAVREARASQRKFFFVLVSVAVGVASLTGVRGFSESFRTMLLREARTVMAADISVRIFGEPTPDQEEALKQLKVENTRVSETVSMVSSPSTPDPVLVSLLRAPFEANSTRRRCSCLKMPASDWMPSWGKSFKSGGSRFA
jgi:putative ABC transport system permease protein